MTDADHANVIHCPECEQRYKLPPGSAGKRLRCKRCRHVFAVPAPPEDSEDKLDFYALMDGDDVARPASSSPDVAAETDAEEEERVADPLRYAQPRDPGPAPEQRGYLPYFKNLGRSLLFFTNGSNLATFIIVFVILLIRDFVGAYGACFAIPAFLIITGWYLAFQFNIVVNAAANDDEIPALTLTGGWFEDIIKPLFRILATYAIAAAPAIIFGMSAGLVTAGLGAGAPGGNPAPGPAGTLQEGIILIICTAAGFFAWPLLVLIVALGSAGSLLRLDLVVQTIVRAFPAYLIVVSIVYISLFVPLISWIVVDELRGTDAAVSIVFTLFGLYATIVAMRAIGLFYHHFKHRFAWSWG